MWVDIIVVGQDDVCKDEAASRQCDLDLISGEKLETIRVCGGEMMGAADGIDIGEVDHELPPRRTRAPQGR
jgi:hypothetical protein